MRFATGEPYVPRENWKYAGLGLLLFLTFGAKLSFQSIIRVPTKFEQSKTVQSRLEARGYQVVVQTGAVDDDTYLLATKDACLMTIAPVAPEDANVYFNSRVVAPENKKGFLFEGAFFDERAPVIRPVLAQAYYRLMNYFGVTVPFKSILAIIATQSCTLE
jgi:hypothetical protein